MKPDQTFLYLHGGPGMNSFAEEEILGPLFSDLGATIKFWNEPSQFQPQNEKFEVESAFSGLLKSAERELLKLYNSSNRPVTLICHSFAANTGYHLALQHSELIERIVLVAPAFHLDEVQRNVIGFSIADFEQKDAVRAQRAQSEIEQSREFFDEFMRNALAVAAENPLLFTHYWKNQSAMENYFSIWAKRGAQMDLDGFYAVMTEFSKIFKEAKAPIQVSVPTYVIFGSLDRVIHMEKEQAACKMRFHSIRTLTLEKSGHFPQLEEAESFASYLTTPQPLENLAETAYRHQLL